MFISSLFPSRLHGWRWRVAKLEVSGLRLLLVILIVCIAGCVRLPEYARPHFIQPGEEAVAGPDSFGYRQLHIEDYRAASLPEKYLQYAYSIQARSCITFVPLPGTAMLIYTGNISGQSVYSGRFTSVGFRALFNPDCSWWNPEITPQRREYVLQHEQIHFAIAELTARKLNLLQVPELKEYLAIGNSVGEVRQDLIAKAQELSHQGLEESMKLHTRFDEETSLFYDQQTQQGWFEKIQKALMSESEIPDLLD